jgi:hypothetical protein
VRRFRSISLINCSITLDNAEGSKLSEKIEKDKINQAKIFS